MLFVIMSKIAQVIAFGVRSVAFVVRFFLDLIHSVTFPLWMLLGLVAWPFYARRIRRQYEALRAEHGVAMADIWIKTIPQDFWAFWQRVRS